VNGAGLTTTASSFAEIDRHDAGYQHITALDDRGEVPPGFPESPRSGPRPSQVLGAVIGGHAPKFAATVLAELPLNGLRSVAR
jgi:hypothetical protein